MEPNCIVCDEQLFSNAKFCHNCGTLQKCKSCETIIVKNAKYCSGCGEALSDNNGSNDNNAVNSIKFNQTAESRSYEVRFTDNVGAGVVEVIRNMSDNLPQSNFLNLSNKSIKKEVNEEVQDITAEEVHEDVNEEEIINKQPDEIPHINDVTNTIECSETNWLLVYSFYNSNNGLNVFDKETVQKTYKDKRGTSSRMKNFSTNWKQLFKELLVKTIKDNEFKLTEKGIKLAFDIIQGKVKSNVSKSSSTKKLTKTTNSENESNKKTGKTGKTPAKSVQIEEFDLFKTANKISLDDFLKEKNIGENTTARILAIAYYITVFCKKNTFSEGNIEYAYKVLKLNKRPLHLYQTILNTKNKSLWYEKESDAGQWKLARPGEVYFEENF